jgi:hypothetical protein
MHALLDFIKGNIEREGENEGMIAALQQQQQPAPSGSATPQPTSDAQPGGDMPQSFDAAAKAYAQNKTLNSAAQQDTEAKLMSAQQNGQLPSLLGSLPPDGQKLLEKYQKNGGGSITDSIKLNGMLNAAMRTSANLQAQKLELARTQMEQVAAAQRTTQFRAQQDALKRLLTNPDVNNDPETAFLAKYAKTYGTMPPAEMLSKIHEQISGIEQPVGVVYAGSQNDDKLGPRDIYNRVYRKMDGTTRVDNSPINLQAGAPAPGNVLDPQTFKAKGSPAGAPDNSYITKSPTQQKAISEASESLAGLQDSSQFIKQYGDAIDEYVATNTKGNQTNAFLGTPKGLAFRAALGDTTGKNLESLAAQALTKTLGSVKGGGRLNANELEALQAANPNATDPNSVLVRKKAALQMGQDVAMKRATLYKANLLAGMTPGEAESKAVDGTPMPDLKDYLKGAPEKPSAYIKDKVYTDKNGIKARWDGSKWVAP